MRRVITLCFVLLLAACAGGQATPDAPAPTRPTGPHVMVAAANPLAVEAGLKVLRAGGSAIDAAVAGLGVTQVLSYQVEAALQAGTLKLILNDLETEPSPVNLVYSGQGLLPLKTRAFIDFAKERLRRELKDL